MITTRTRVAAAVAVAATAAMTAAVLGASPAHADGIVLGADAPNAISGEYIVAMHDGTSSRSANGLLADYGATVTDSFASIDGFAVKMSADEARALAGDPSVEYVAQNGEVSIAGTQSNPPSWGLDRIDQASLPLDNSYSYPDSAGSGVTAYIIDTGADLDHPDFAGRMTSGTDTVDNDSDASDCNGHGTHVSGTVGGTSYGVAKSVNLVAVRVLDCGGSGTFAGVIAGIDWVTQNHSGDAVANMSLGGGFDQSVNDAVTASINSGVTYALAAGNNYGADACSGSPGSTPDALTVGSTNSSDNRSTFSNVGNCVDIFAPGEGITSAWLNGGSNTISGTSMATPHVCGAAALYLGLNPGSSPAAVGGALVDNASNGVVGNPGAGSPNKLLYTGFML
jgi:subtilisin family serine protease